jgi:hypothetical protein
LILALVAVARAAAPDFQADIDQARLDIKREWWDDARTQLEAAVATDDGALDAEAWLLLATVRYQLCDVPGARFAADRAHVNSRDLDQAGQASGLRDWIDQSFGAVEVTAPREGVVHRLKIELTGAVLDPDLKGYLNRLLPRYDRAVDLPVTVWLPASTYRIDEQEVVVAPRATTSVAPSVANGALQAATLELGFGPTFWVGRDAKVLLPVPTTALSASFPVGPLILGFGGAWDPQPYRTVTEAVRIDPQGWELGGRVGVEVGHSDPLIFRVSAGYAYGVIPGVQLACSSDDGQAWKCGGLDPAGLYVHAPVRASLPRVELAGTYLDRSRNSRFGAGLDATVEYALGRVHPTEAVAPDGSTYDWTLASAAGRFAALGIRGLATFTLAF